MKDFKDFDDDIKEDENPFTENTCRLCHNLATDTHHIFPGTARRKISDREHLTIRLCHRCHMGLHNGNSQQMREFQREAQEHWESQPGHTREKWIAMMGRSWL